MVAETRFKSLDPLEIEQIRSKVLAKVCPPSLAPSSNFQNFNSTFQAF